MKRRLANALTGFARGGTLGHLLTPESVGSPTIQSGPFPLEKQPGSPQLPTLPPRAQQNNPVQRRKIPPAVQQPARQKGLGPPGGLPMPFGGVGGLDPAMIPPLPQHLQNYGSTFSRPDRGSLGQPGFSGSGSIDEIMRALHKGSR
jgi:hypothetical protein